MAISRLLSSLTMNDERLLVSLVVVCLGETKRQIMEAGDAIARQSNFVNLGNKFH